MYSWNCTWAFKMATLHVYSWKPTLCICASFHDNKDNRHFNAGTGLRQVKVHSLLLHLSHLWCFTISSNFSTNILYIQFSALIIFWGYSSSGKNFLLKDMFIFEVCYILPNCSQKVVPIYIPSTFKVPPAPSLAWGLLILLTLSFWSGFSRFFKIC